MLTDSANELVLLNDGGYRMFRVGNDQRSRLGENAHCAGAVIGLYSTAEVRVQGS